MNLRELHPKYAEAAQDWQKLSDCYAGERVVKEAGTLYLPPTAGQILDGMQSTPFSALYASPGVTKPNVDAITPNTRGRQSYDAYKLRARFPDFISQAVEALLGIMHDKPPIIKLPAKLEPLRDRCNTKNESLEMLLRRINEQQLVTGRLGLLADVPTGSGPDVLPYIALYVAKDIVNWDAGEREVVQKLKLVVMNESEWVREGFGWKWDEKYRVLLLHTRDHVYRAGLFDPDEEGLFHVDDQGDIITMERGEPDVTNVESTSAVPGDIDLVDQNKLVELSIAGRTLDRIPFVFINSKDVVPETDNPPLLGLAELALAVYRAEADYRQSLYMTGQDTLVIVGGLSGEEETRVGAGAKIEVNQGGDAKYIGVSGAGISEMRQSLDMDRKIAAEMGGRLLDTTSRQEESGIALRIRVAARTASLNQIALAGAEGLQAVLRIMAEWVGANPDEVQVEPNLDFVDDELSSQDLVGYMTAKNLGAPISSVSIHRLMQEKDLTEMSYEDEMAAIESEIPLAAKFSAEAAALGPPQPQDGGQP